MKQNWLRGTARHRWLPIAAVVAVAAVAGTTAAFAATHSTNVANLAGSATSASSASASGSSAGSSAASGSGTVSTKGFPTGAGVPGIFTDRCAYSHEAADDPILAPGKPGTSMHHDFYGNTTTTAASTAASLVGGHSTCTTAADASAYWTPVLYQGGHELTPSTALIYWRKPAVQSGAVHTIPAGLQLIAGNEAATAPQSVDVTAWTCTKTRGGAGAAGGVVGAGGRRTATPHACAAGTDLRLTVTFPSCWDGHTLTGAGQTNVVYRTATGCPSSHPVPIPQIVFHVNYPTSSATGLTVSMTPTMQGSTDTEHVDFVNGWTQATLDRDVAACVSTSTRCGPVTGTQATPHGPVIQRMRAGRRAGMKTGQRRHR